MGSGEVVQWSAFVLQTIWTRLFKQGKRKHQINRFSHSRACLLINFLTSCTKTDIDLSRMPFYRVVFHPHLKYNIKCARLRRKLLLIGPLGTCDPLIAYRQVSVGEYRYRYAAGVCASPGWVLVTSLAVSSPRLKSNWEPLRSRGPFHLDSRNRQVIGIFRPSAQEIH